MQHRYSGLPAAASVEQSIILAQILIQRDLTLRSSSDLDQPTPLRPIEGLREHLQIRRRHAA
jgi:hypothetical protein